MINCSYISNSQAELDIKRNIDAGSCNPGRDPLATTGRPLNSGGQTDPAHDLGGAAAAC